MSFIFYENIENRQTEIPRSGPKNPEEPCLVLTTPPQSENKAKKVGEVFLRRIRHGITRAIENLRELRLPLVQDFDANECVRRECEAKLQAFPAPDTRKRRGRKSRVPRGQVFVRAVESRKPVMKIWAAAEALGGAE